MTTNESKQIASRARNAEICRLRREGCTLQEIADAFGLSRQRIEQMTESRASPTSRKNMVRNRKSEAIIRACREAGLCRRLIEDAIRLVVPWFDEVPERSMGLSVRSVAIAFWLGFGVSQREAAIRSGVDYAHSPEPCRILKRLRQAGIEISFGRGRKGSRSLRFNGKPVCGGGWK